MNVSISGENTSFNIFHIQPVFCLLPLLVCTQSGYGSQPAKYGYQGEYNLHDVMLQKVEDGGHVTDVQDRGEEGEARYPPEPAQ